MNRHSATQRGGAVLLVVLALLAVFGVMALTFIVTTGHARRGAEADQRDEQFFDPADQVLEQAAMQVVRGTNNPLSSLWCHSLLEDIYGNRHAIGQLSAASNLHGVAGGQLWVFTANLTDALPNTNAARPEAWVGSVITFVHGPPTGISSRIVDYNPSTGEYVIVAPEETPIGQVAAYLAAGNAINYVINGAPFSGTGVGYDGSNTLGAAHPDGRPFALLPNPSDPEFVAWVAGPDGLLGTTDDRDLMANEDYDAADYQNVLLAMQLPDGSVPEPSAHRVALINYWFEQAINDTTGTYINWGGISDPNVRRQFLLSPETAPPPLRKEIAKWKRRFVLRPLTAFHPGFDGSNPLYNDLTGPWDVDNDGDGVPDSVWLDLGLPVRTMPDGRRYKPLVAVMCVDLDGRFNLNAQGSLFQADPDYYQPSSQRQDGVPPSPPWPRMIATYPDPASAPPNGYPIGTDILTQALMNEFGFRGLGFGPGEINLLPLFDGTDVFLGPNGPRTLYARLLTGTVSPAGPVPGRYGERFQLLTAPPYPAAGFTGQPELHLLNKFFDYPWQDWRQTLWPPYGAGNQTAYGSPPDMLGVMTVALDLHGWPLYQQVTNSWTIAAVESQYKLNLSQKRGRRTLSGATTVAVDAPFTPEELEALLRPYDADSAGLPDRLLKLVYVPTAPADLQAWLQAHRHEITTESWDVPVPALAGTKPWRDAAPRGGGTPAHTSDVFGNSLTPQQLLDLMPPELQAGLRFDLNRPFGDGRDNDGDNVVDDPGEAISGADMIAYSTPGGPLNTPLQDYDRNGIIDQDPSNPVPAADRDPRILYARHLYVLTMALCDRDYLNELTGSPLATARMIAQWAVNVADFRDRDSIMTRFVFDEDPFDGWNPPPGPGDPAFDAYLYETHTVWGCERPELLITETLAFHDRRTEDLPDFGLAVNPPQPSDGEDQNPGPYGDQIIDFDQQFRPQGSLFVELYNPWPENEPPAAEFDTPAKTAPANVPGVDLAKVNASGTPIWRLAIAKPSETDPLAPSPPGPGGFTLEPDPDDPDPTQRPTIERLVYFADQGSVASYPVEDPTKTLVAYHPSPANAATIGKILPGRYAVIGPGGPPDGNLTFIGINTFPPDPNNDRHIRIDPTDVQVVNNNTAPPLGIQQPVGIVIDQGFVFSGIGDVDLRLSVSEPANGGYAPLEAGEVDETGQPIQYNPATGRYEDAGNPQAIDQPLDAQRTDLDPGETWDELFGRTTTKTKFRIVHLQRLANPLEPYDPYLNPYRTIDSEPVDLTVFNSRMPMSEPDFLADGSARFPANEDIMFHTRQRGESNDDPDLSDANTVDAWILWKQEPGYKEVVDDPATIGAAGFNRQLKHTLGYLNEFFDPTPRDGSMPPTPIYAGEPHHPFPWLTWFNRPFTSPLELLLVPGHRSSRLLAYDEAVYAKYYRIVNRESSNPDPVPNVYVHQLVAPSAPNAPDGPMANPFPHLWNFFHALDSSATTPGSPKFHRLLEFVRTRSPFTGTELPLNPTAAAPAGLPGSGHRFAPPYNFIDAYREPGRINLNTIYSEAVWRGLLNQPDTSDSRTPFDEFLRSRRGYPDTSGNPLTALNPNYPTRFANPFRSFGGATNVPPTTPIGADPTLRDLIQHEVNATLLRPAPDPTGFGFQNRPLFVPQSWIDPTVTAATNHAYEFANADRNPFFRYQHLMRLGNLTTTRSNVYAVWLTVGYFEVEPVPAAGPDGTMTPAEVAEIYPDGYMLGQELGSDTGEIKRHRMFFLFDRSLPMGFLRGEDLNVEQGFLLKRIIE